MTYRGQTAKQLANGEYRLTTHMLFTEYVKPLNVLAPFKTGGALCGRDDIAPGVGLGRLPAQYRESANRADYVVYSYGTPIAWHIPATHGHFAQPGRWVMPDERYSKTTSKHQGTIRTALSLQLEAVKAA